MQTHGHPNLDVKPAGFVVHPIKEWEGASPEAWVTDPTSRYTQGIAEFVCIQSVTNVPWMYAKTQNSVVL